MDMRLTRQARGDLEDIRRYTVQTWGQDRWLSYFNGLMAAFERASSDGTCGRPRDDLRPGMRCLGYQQHLVFFQSIAHAGGATVILRIVHQRRDLAALSYYDSLEG